MSEEDYTMDNGNIEISYQDVSEYILVEDQFSDFIRYLFAKITVPQEISTSHWCSITCYEKTVNVSDEILVHFDTPVVHIHGNEESIKDMIEAEDYR